MNIRNASDLADYIAANEPTEKSISRRIDKDHGAWLTFESDPPKGKTVKATWQVCVSPHIIGIVVPGVRRRGRGPWITKDDFGTLPPELVSYLNLTERTPGRWVLGDFGPYADPDMRGMKGLRGCVEQDEDCRLDRNANLWVMIDECRPTKRKPPTDGVWGVQVGSSFEDTGVDVTADTLFFPFDSDDFDTALQWIEDTMNELYIYHDIDARRSAHEDQTYHEARENPPWKD